MKWRTTRRTRFSKAGPREPRPDVSGSRIWADYEEETKVEPRRGGRRVGPRRRRAAVAAVEIGMESIASTTDEPMFEVEEGPTIDVHQGAVGRIKGRPAQGSRGGARLRVRRVRRKGHDAHAAPFEIQAQHGHPEERE